VEPYKHAAREFKWLKSLRMRNRWSRQASEGPDKTSADIYKCRRCEGATPDLSVDTKECTFQEVMESLSRGENPEAWRAAEIVP
jgi:hypothetical protein